VWHSRALAIEPGLLLLDEPFGALDATVRKNLRIWLRGLHDRMGLTSIFVTHDQAEAMEIADRVAVLRAGRVEQVDVPDTLYAEPVSAFVHEFLGESVDSIAWLRQAKPVSKDYQTAPFPPIARRARRSR
jgi:sulfate transport system ATP-binding protein